MLNSLTHTHNPHQSRDHAAMRPGDRGHRLNIRIGDQSAADPGFTPVLCMWGPGAGDTGRVEGSQSWHDTDGEWVYRLLVLGWCRHGGYQEWRLSSKGPLNPLHWHKINCILCNTKLITPISLLQRPYILNAHYKNMPTRLSVVCNLWPVEQCVLRCQANTIHDTIFHLCLCICPYIFLSFSMRIIC